jgi:WD40 repeat protein
LNFGILFLLSIKFYNFINVLKLLIKKGHSGEVISISFNTDGDKILTGSFDFTAKVFLIKNKNLKNLKKN